MNCSHPGQFQSRAHYLSLRSSTSSQPFLASVGGTKFQLQVTWNAFSTALRLTHGVHLLFSMSRPPPATLSSLIPASTSSGGLPCPSSNSGPGYSQQMSGGAPDCSEGLTSCFAGPASCLCSGCYSALQAASILSTNQMEHRGPGPAGSRRTHRQSTAMAGSLPSGLLQDSGSLALPAAPSCTLQQAGPASRLPRQALHWPPPLLPALALLS